MLLALGIILIVAEVALILNMFDPAMSASKRKGPRKQVPSRGSVKSTTVGIYWDQALTNPVSSVDWGTLDPGSSVNRTMLIQNEGNTDAALSIGTSNWNPSDASSYITLSWDYGGQTLNANQVVQMKLTLFVSVSTTGITDFSFDITIAAGG